MPTHANRMMCPLPSHAHASNTGAHLSSTVRVVHCGGRAAPSSRRTPAVSRTAQGRRFLLAAASDSACVSFM